MKVIICVDEKYGVSFNNRRQSRDSVLIKDMTENYNPLYITDYSSSIFGEHLQKTTILDNTKDISTLSGFIFLERNDLLEFQDKIDTLIIYNWCKVYPADKFLKINLSEYKKLEQTEIIGSSHEKILKEIYVK